MSKYFDQTNMFLEPKVTQHGSHMVMTDVVMPTKTKYLSIDTRFRDKYDSSSLADYIITLPERVNNVRSMELQSVTFALTQPTVGDWCGNNCFELKIGSTTKTVRLDNKNYPLWSDLVTEVQAKINALGAPFDNSGGAGVEYAINSTATKGTKEHGQSSFTNNNASACTITFDKSDCTRPSASKGQKFGYMTGFRLNEYTIENGETQSSESIVMNSFDDYYYLIIDEFSNANPHSFMAPLTSSELSSQQIIGRITRPNNFSGWDLIVADKNQNLIADIRKYSNEINIQRLRVQLVNPFGKVLDLNGTDFSFCLKLEYL